MKVKTVGRSQENDIVIDDVKVSRNHLQIVEDDSGNYSAVDLNSSNGTFVNNRRIAGEVRLQPNDVVKIGNTPLPWLSYFNAPVISNSGQMSTPQQPRQQRQPKRTLWYIAVGIIFLLLVSGGVIFKMYYDANQENIELAAKAKTEVEENERIQKEVNRKNAVAKQLQAESDDLFAKALISRSEKDKKLADDKKKEAETATREAHKAQVAQATAIRERDEANSKAIEANTAKSIAEKAKLQAITATKEAESTAVKANAAKTNAEMTAKLTQEFYKTFPRVTGKDYPQMICDKLNETAPKGKTKKEFIEDLFDKADNTQKQKIIRVINEVLGIQNKDEKANDQADASVAPGK